MRSCKRPPRFSYCIIYGGSLAFSEPCSFEGVIAFCFKVLDCPIETLFKQKHFFYQILMSSVLRNINQICQRCSKCSCFVFNIMNLRPKRDVLSPVAKVPG